MLKHYRKDSQPSIISNLTPFLLPILWERSSGAIVAPSSSLRPRQCPRLNDFPIGHGIGSSDAVCKPAFLFAALTLIQLRGFRLSRDAVPYRVGDPQTIFHAHSINAELRKRGYHARLSNRLLVPTLLRAERLGFRRSASSSYMIQLPPCLDHKRPQSGKKRRSARRSVGTRKAKAPRSVNAKPFSHSSVGTRRYLSFWRSNLASTSFLGKHPPRPPAKKLRLNVAQPGSLISNHSHDRHFFARQPPFMFIESVRQ